MYLADLLALHDRDPLENLQPYQIVRTAQRQARERMDIDESDQDSEDEREKFQTGLKTMTKRYQHNLTSLKDNGKLF